MLHRPLIRVRLTAAALVAACAACAGAGVAALPASAHATHRGRVGTPACTRAALQAGLTRGAARLGRRARVVRPFACERGWATAGVITGGIEVTSVFRAQGGRWTTVDRSRPCARGEIPRRIRRAACDTN